MKRIEGLFAPIHGQPALKLVDGKLFQRTLGRGRRAEDDNLGTRCHIDRSDPDNAADGPHFDDNFAPIGAPFVHCAPATRCREIMGPRTPQRNRQQVHFRSRILRRQARKGETKYPFRLFARSQDCLGKSTVLRRSIASGPDSEVYGKLKSLASCKVDVAHYRSFFCAGAREVLTAHEETE
jgi:hypothetical protein